jgi:hypothetical protein
MGLHISCFLVYWLLVKSHSLTLTVWFESSVWINCSFQTCGVTTLCVVLYFIPNTA